MKIGFFTDTYLPAIHGITVSLKSFRKSLEDLGQEVFIFAPRHRGYVDKEPNIFRFRSLRIIRKPEMFFALPFLPVKNFRKIIKIKLDIIHSHTPFSMGFFGKGIAYYQKLPFIYTHHTQYPDYARIYTKERFFIPRLTKHLIKRHSNISSAVIAPSRKIKKVLRGYGVKRPIYVLPTGVDLSIFKPVPQNSQFLKKKLGVSPKTKILLYVGRIAEEKNLRFLIEVFAEIMKRRKDVLLALVGDGPYLAKLSNLVKSLNLINNVWFIGPVVHEEIPVFYQSSDVFVFSSLTDTQGTVVSEAISCGLPIIALKDDVLRGMIVDGKNGFLVEKPSVFDFAGKILKVLDNNLLYQKFSAASLELADHFSQKKQAARLLDIYKTSLKLAEKK